MEIFLKLLLLRKRASPITESVRRPQGHTLRVLTSFYIAQLFWGVLRSPQPMFSSPELRFVIQFALLEKSNRQPNAYSIKNKSILNAKARNTKTVK